MIEIIILLQQIFVSVNQKHFFEILRSFVIEAYVLLSQGWT